MAEVYLENPRNICDLDGLQNQENTILSSVFGENLQPPNEFNEVFYPQLNAEYKYDHDNKQIQIDRRRIYEAIPINNVYKKPCNCTKSHCLKLYCECFARGSACDNCNCKNCMNNALHDEARQKAVKMTLEKNPAAFHPKIGEADRRHSKGCNCKRSGCLKNYCECYEAKIHCSDLCRCQGCRNFGSGCQRGENAKNILITMAQPKGMYSNKSSYNPHMGVLQEINGAYVKLPHANQAFGRYAMWSTANGPNGSSDQLISNAFLSPETVEAACSCMMSRLDESKFRGYSLEMQEFGVLEEFDKCLEQIMESALKVSSMSSSHYGGEYFPDTQRTHSEHPAPTEHLALKDSTHVYNLSSDPSNQDRNGRYIEYTDQLPQKDGFTYTGPVLNSAVLPDISEQGFVIRPSEQVDSSTKLYEISNFNESIIPNANMHFLPPVAHTADQSETFEQRGAPYTYVSNPIDPLPAFRVDSYNLPVQLVVRPQEAHCSSSLAYLPQSEMLLNSEEETARQQMEFVKAAEDQEVHNATAALLSATSESTNDYAISSHFDLPDASEVTLNDSVYLLAQNQLPEANNNFVLLNRQNESQYTSDLLGSEAYQLTDIPDTGRSLLQDGTIVLKPDMGYFTFST